jgi:hypothetical protein
MKFEYFFSIGRRLKRMNEHGPRSEPFRGRWEFKCRPFGCNSGQIESVIIALKWITLIWWNWMRIKRREEAAIERDVGRPFTFLCGWAFESQNKQPPGHQIQVKDADRGLDSKQIRTVTYLTCFPHETFWLVSGQTICLQAVYPARIWRKCLQMDIVG